MQYVMTSSNLEPLFKVYDFSWFNDYMIPNKPHKTDLSFLLKRNQTKQNRKNMMFVETDA